MDNPTFILAGNGPYVNRGCEAIVRGTTKILREIYKDPKFVCLSFFHNEQQYANQCNEETDPSVTHIPAYRLGIRKNIKNLWKPDYFKYYFKYFLRPNSLKYQIYKEMIPYVDSSLAVLSIGGDNYSSSYGIPKIYTDLDDIVLEKKKPLFLWGASIGPFNDNPHYQKYISEHFQNVTGIFARESVTKKYLDSINVKENVHMVADPAFLMEPVKPKISADDFFFDEDAIGFNISPLMARYATGGDIEKWTKMVVSILTRVSKDTDMPIYLIPHVTSPHSDDFTFMKTVLKKIEVKKNDITLIPPKYNAAETKWIISNMTIFAGARTHSTVASLSSGVPTLSFVYSIKGLGINDDIFGHTNFCIESKYINADSVSKKTSDILDLSNDIKLELSEIIPRIQNRAMSGGLHIKNIMNKIN